MSIKVKRGLAINLPTLEEGELGFTTDSYEMYVGSNNGNILLNNGEILIRRNNGMLQYAQSNRKNQWFDICSLEEIRGDQGIQGIQGIQGVKGDKGDKGERGIQGEKGNPFTYADFTPDQLRALKGEKGDTGAKGERGLTGDKGDRGVGLNYAWSGTRLGVKRDTDAQYTYVDLRGADGRDGKQGERGERGIQGEKGDTPSIAHLEKQISDKSNELDTKFNTLTAKQQQDAEVVTARDGEVSLHARLERDLEKGKIHFVDVGGSDISTESEEGYLENVEIHGNTWQDANNLSDIRSVGTKVEGQELYEIPVVSCGKNICNGEKLYPKSINLTTGQLMEGINNVVDLYEVQPNTTYTTSVNGVARPTNVFYYDKDKKFLHKDALVLANFTTPSNAKYVRHYYGTNGEEDLIQTEVGTKATPYESYKEDKLTILSPVQLEKVGDVADRIICKDGVWRVEKNIETVILNGSEAWDLQSTGVADSVMVAGRCVTSFDFINPSIVENKHLCFPLPTKYHTNWDSSDIEGIHLAPTQNEIFINILTNKIGSKTLANFKAWLSNNPQTVKLQLTQPQFIPLPHDQQIKLRTFAERTHITCDTEIEGTIKAQVPKSLGATVNTHTTQIDNLNKELDRVKKLEESTVSTVTSDKAFTTVSETNQGYFEDVKVEGKTLVNLANMSGTYARKATDNSTYNGRVPLSRGLKANTTYTRIINVSKVNLGTNSLIRMYDAFNDVNGMYKQYPWGVITTTGVYVSTFTIGDTDTLPVYQINPDSMAFKETTGAELEIDKMVLLEGDHTDKDLNFFEGLKSVGQDVDEIEISSQYNLADIATSGDNANFSIANLKAGKTYTIKSKRDNNSIQYNLMLADPKDVYITRQQLVMGTTKDCYTFTTTKDGVLRFNGYSNPINVSEIMLVEGVYTDSTMPKFKPYSVNKKQILYFNPTTQTWEKPVLREWDSIEKHSDGKYYYHKRSGEVVLNGAEEWLKSSSNGADGSSKYFLRLRNCVISWDNNFICDKLQVSNNEVVDTVKITPIDNNAVSALYVYINIQNVEGFKTWLQANNVTVVYQLKQEEVYECTNLDLITYSVITHLIVNSGAIQPRIALKVLSNVSNVVKLLQEKVSILENKFIKGLQQVLAGDMMSLAHLLYPQDFTLENDTPQVIPYIEEGDINE